MRVIETTEALEALYETVNARSIEKVQTFLTPLYRRWIDTAKFCILTTVGPGGTYRHGRTCLTDVHDSRK